MAEGIAGVASAQRTGCGLYHVVNPHWDDNVSLDTFLGWIQNAGYPLKQIPDYSQWCATWTLRCGHDMPHHSCPMPVLLQTVALLRGRACMLRMRACIHISFDAVPEGNVSRRGAAAAPDQSSASDNALRDWCRLSWPSGGLGCQSSGAAYHL